MKWIIAFLVIGLAGTYFLGDLLWKRETILQNELPLVVDLYNEQVESKGVDQVFVSELHFLLEAAKLAHAHGWTGDRNSPIPVRVTDIDPELMTRFVVREQEREAGLWIPENLYSLYTTDTAVTEMVTLIQQVRGEFLAYAQAKGVRRAYLQEIETMTLPNEPGRLNYFPNRRYPDIRNTNVHTYEQSLPGKYRQLQMDVYASNVYKKALEIERSGIVGTDAKVCRDMALRYVVFHEMTHVLQHAMHVVNAPLSAQETLLPWLQAHRTVLEIDKQHYQTWGGQTDPLSREINNMEIAKESQAEGIAITMLGDVYRLSSRQRAQLWEHHFGSLRNGTEAINQTFALVTSWYPDVNVAHFIHRLGYELLSTPQLNLPLEQRITVTHMLERLDGFIAVHLGYLNPMAPEATELFWTYLQQ